MEGPVQNNNTSSMSFMNRGPAMNGEMRLDGDHRTDAGTAALHHATMRVNSLSLSETPTLRKRNREDDDHSFRVDKMTENPSNIPRSQAMLSADEYKQQQQQQHQHQQQQMAGQGAGYGREDSLTTVLLPLFLPHSNSNGSTGSGSIMNMLASQDTMNQDPNMMQGANNMQPSTSQNSNVDNKNMFPSFTMGDHQQFISGFKPGFVQGQGMPFAFMNPILSSQVLGSQQSLQSQNSGLSLPSQTSGLNLGSQTSGLNLGSQTSGLNLPSQGSGLNLGSTTSGLNLGSSASGMNLGNSPSGLNLGSSASGLNLGPSSPGLNLGSQSSGLSLGNSSILGLNLSQLPLSMGGMQPNVSLGMNNNSGNLGNGFQGAPAFLSFGAMPPRGQGFESYMADGRPRYDQGQVASGAPAFFPYAFPSATDAFMSGTTSKRSPSGSGGAKGKKGGSKSKSSLHSQPSTGSSEKYVSWSVEQENALVSAVEELGTDDWEAIAARIPGGHRTGAQCLRHWENKLSPHIKRGQWSPEEDEALKKLVERASAQGLGLLDIPWEDIKPYIPGRTLKQVRERWRSNLDPSIIRGDWTPWEDEMIIKMRDEQGMGWASIARALKGRTEHSVKTRHRSMQRAKKRAWTEKEDRVILDMVAQGTNFSTIAAELKNRTATSVEMRWNELNGRS